jgi:hypothetical protein
MCECENNPSALCGECIGKTQEMKIWSNVIAKSVVENAKTSNALESKKTSAF